ncbi:MAG: nicotinate-nucleotide adenylyltransferase [Mucilaginibacter polytrichastri]|nr:nicotinate-nucleotide adenylyltransferase [Mucilaginibacter polytrichastri]
MKIGLFFGSFNPIHTGHLIIAQYMAGFTTLDKVWLVVSPQNPFKTPEGLINMYDRLEMAKLATEQADRIEVSDIELHLPTPSYTVDTLAHLAERYPQHEFSIIMGEDNLASLRKWKNYEIILRDYSVFVYPRPGAKAHTFGDHPKISVTDTPLIEISSTFIRKALKEGFSPRFFVPDRVLGFIDAKNLYR